MKQIYVVLGLPRSGTSAITRALQALGVGLEGNLQPARSINPKGFWEDVDIMYGINRTVTHINGDKIITADRLAEKSETGARLRDMQAAAEKLLQQRFKNAQQWGFKDVRTGEMLPFWQAVFANMRLKENYIIALRHPLSRAYSNQQFNHHDIEYGLISWLDYLIRVIDQTEHKSRVVVSYELMLEQPLQQMTHIRDTLGISLMNDDELKVYIDEFLDNKLKHYSFNEDDTASNAAMAVGPLCAKVYHLLLRTAKGELALNDTIFTAAWKEIKLTYQAIEPIYKYIHRIQNEKKQLERQLKAMQKSFLWKFMYPLRLVEDMLRRKRLIKRVRNYEIRARERYST